jgi:hypothetical protein
MWSSVVFECSLAVIIFLPKLAELRIAKVGAPFVFNCFAKERLASIAGEAVRAFLMIAFSSLVRTEWWILKNVREDVSVCSSGRSLILAMRVLRYGVCSK